MKLNLNIGPLGPDGTIKLQAFVALARQGEQGIQGPQGDTGPQGPQGIQGPQGEQGPGIEPDDPRLSDAREWTAATVDQAEAEAGASTDRRAWTAQRVRQAMLGWWGGFAAKATPVDADSIVIADSAASNAPKRLSWSNAVAKLRGTFVEGPASAVDGQVMVFDGATGKKAKSGGALGAFAYHDYVSPKFDGGKSGANLAVNTSDFTGAPLLAPYNGSTLSQAGKFIHNNSDFGGAGGAMAPTVVDLINAAGRILGNARYGVEFIVCEISVGAGTAAGISVGANTYYPASINTNLNFYGIDGYATFFMWVRAVGQSFAILKRNDLLINGVAKSANTVVTTSDGWVHCQHSDFAPNGYSTGAPYLYGIPGGKIQIALPMVIPKRVTTWTNHVAPVPFGGLGFF